METIIYISVKNNLAISEASVSV